MYTATHRILATLAERHKTSAVRLMSTTTKLFVQAVWHDHEDIYDLRLLAQLSGEEVSNVSYVKKGYMYI
jgi:hypothetical protein